MDHPTDRITHTTAFVTPVVEHWLETEETEIQTNKTQGNRHDESDRQETSRVTDRQLNLL